MLFAEGTRYSRRDIVLGVAEQEGGAHVAATPTAEYEKLMTPGLMWDLVEVADGVETITPAADVRFKYIRQMAYELLNSPELLKLAEYSPTRPAKRETQPADDDVDDEPQDEPEILDEPDQELHDPEPQRPRPAGVKLTTEDLERIREEVMRYFRAYYAEFRDEIEKRDPDAKLDYLRGRRRIVFEMGNDGAIITHFPTEDDDDAFEFVLPKTRWCGSWPTTWRSRPRAGRRSEFTSTIVSAKISGRIRSWGLSPTKKRISTTVLSTTAPPGCGSTGPVGSTSTGGVTRTAPGKTLG